MSERRHDKLLGIRTIGLRDWPDDSDYNRYEATPYRALEHLFTYYSMEETDCLVDFGCGRGRVLFYIHNRFQIPVTGIEAHDVTYGEAINNEYTYRHKAKGINAPIHLKFGLAQHYTIKPEDNCFYFFNPFSERIFKKVIVNIHHSLRKHERSVDLILYYPMPKYKQILKYHTPFELINKVRLPKVSDHREKFLIYRYVPSAG